MKRLLLVLLSSFLLAACSSGELVGVHVLLAKDGSGVVTTRSLQETLTMGPGESKTQGIAWESRANLCCSQGRFTAINDLKLGDGSIQFLKSSGVGPDMLRTTVQVGAGAAWVAGFVPGAAERQAMARVYDPTGKTREIGGDVRIEVQLPEGTKIVGSSVRPTGRGVDAGYERNRAYLVVPVKTALEKGDELVWDVSW